MTRTRRAQAATAILVLAIAAVAAIALPGAGPPDSSASGTPVSTAKVQRGRLSAVVSAGGTLTYAGRPDGSPSPAINQARGVYTRLPESGDRVGCGGVLYRVDDRPVLLLCGAIPAFRTLRVGMEGRDVRQLNADLHRLGDDAAAHVRIGVGDRAFTARTQRALRALQRRRGVAATGRLELGDAIFAPKAVRIAKVSGQLGGPAQPGAALLSATSDTLHVQVDLDPSQQGEVRRGDRAQIVLPGNTPVVGRVTGFGRVAQTPDGPGGQAADATVPTFIRLDDPAQARGLDRAPVTVDITTKGVDDALSVPVTALLGRSGGGFAVEVMRTGGRRALVAVTLGLFDTGGGRVQVEGRLGANDLVVVPSL